MRTFLFRPGLWFWAFIVSVLSLGVWLRFVGQNWDEGTLLHPDERFLLMVTGSVKWVSSWSEFFDTARSTLNPHNQNFGFYVYGTFPLFLARFIADLLPQAFPIHITCRIISACFDLATCLLVLASSCLLFGRLAAAIAFLISTTCVLQIQLSHFGAFDSHGAFLTTAVFFLSLLIAYRPKYSLVWLIPLAGIVTGMAAATKINLLLVFGLIPLSVLIRGWPQGWWPAFSKSFVFSVLALIPLTLTFRLLQPYAFAGPSFFNFAPNPKWISNISDLASMAKGTLGFPPGVQWVERSRLHGLLNLVQWGFPLPLGILALLSLLLAVQRVLARDIRYLVPIIWATVSLVVFVVLPYIQPVRYAAPCYPILALLIASFLAPMLDPNGSLTRFPWRHFESKAAKTVVVLLLIISILWGIAFVSIYRNSHPRLVASRWMLSKIPGPVTLVGRAADGEMKIPLSVSSNSDQPILLPQTISFSVSTDFKAHELLIPKLKSFSENSTLVFKIDDEDGRQISGEVALPSSSLQTSSIRIPFPRSFSISPGQQKILTISAKDAVKIELKRIHFAQESSWDDSLPARIDGFDPYGGIYEGKYNLEMYWRDSEKKVKRLAQGLANADYFYLSSNRQVGTIGRLPKEFPIAAEFYRKLLGCSAREYLPRCYAEAKIGHREGVLGYELISVHQSFPSLFGFSFNSQFADEAFQVYDHPKVLIFQNKLHLTEETLTKLLTPLSYGNLSSD